LPGNPTLLRLADRYGGEEIEPRRMKLCEIVDAS
jgi:hypothetical protein